MTRKELKEVAIVTAVAAMLTIDLSRLDSSVYNNYTRLAWAFLHGQVAIYWPGAYIDAIAYHGARYVIEGPIPAVLLMPFVAVFAGSTNQTLFACATASLATGGAWLVARRANAGLPLAVAATGFFLVGTPLLWCAIYGAVWYVAHTVATMFAIFAVAELMGKRRPWLVALFLVLAAGSRFTLVLALVPLLAYALAGVPAARRAVALANLSAVLIVSAGLYVAYNLARWGVPNDIGYTMWYHQDQIGEPEGSPFRIEYFTYELTAFFATIPTIVNRYPWVIPAYGAVSMDVTSPALVLAFLARGRWALVATLWVAAALVAGPSFLYYANGGTQWGMRHMLDFVPFLFPLLVMGAQRVWAWIGYTLCAVSIVVGIWGIWYWRTFYDGYLVHKAYGG